MGQIENELGEEREDTFFDVAPKESKSHTGKPTSFSDENAVRWLEDTAIINDDTDGSGSEAIDKVTVQDYADWCGSLVEKLSPNVVWTMCNGLSANNTIITCNGNSCTGWIEHNGGTGKVQVDQPAMWTEGKRMLGCVLVSVY